MSQPAFDFAADVALDPAGVEASDPTWSVRQLADAVNGVLHGAFGGGVWVRGEIRGWSGNRQHAYFQLVEDTPDGKAAVEVAFFAGPRARLRPLLEQHRLALADGLKVRIFGRLDFYAPTGRLSFKMSDVDPRYTLGEMAIERDQIVQRLIAAGHYDANRGCSLVRPPLRVGLVTSVDTAAWHDATNELQRSGFGFHLKVVDVRVQGDDAPPMIAGAIGRLAGRSDLDVIMVIRGGGSRTDLAAFDAEQVAMAIARSRLPVITGIGHETDRSIADEVAFRAFKTPTACAAALVEATRAYLDGVEQAWQGITRVSTGHVERSATRLAQVAHHVRHRTVAAVERSDQRLTNQATQVAARTRRVLDQHEQRLARAKVDLGRFSTRRLDAVGRDLDQVAAKVHLLDPARTLARGWSITRGPDGAVVRDVATVHPGDRLTTMFATGSVTSRVEDPDAASHS